MKKLDPQVSVQQVDVASDLSASLMQQPALPAVQKSARNRVLALLAAGAMTALAETACGPNFTVGGMGPDDTGAGGGETGGSDVGGGDAGGGDTGGNDTGGGDAGGGETGGDGGGGEAPVVYPVDSSKSGFTLVSPVPTPKVLGVEGDGVQTGLMKVVLKDTMDNVVPGKKVSVAKSSGPGVPLIDAVNCTSGVSLGNVPPHEATSDAMGEVCYKVSSTTFGLDEFTATEKTSDPDVVIAQKPNVTFCYGITFDTTDGTMPKYDFKFFKPDCSALDAVNLNTAGSAFEMAPITACQLPPFKVAVDVSNAAAKNSLTQIVTNPSKITNPARVKDVGSTSVSDSFMNNICADPTVGGTSGSVNPVSGDKNPPGTDKTMRLEAVSPADASGGAVWYYEVNL